MEKAARPILRAAAFLYAMGLGLIYWAYRKKIFWVHRLEAPVVSVGNLTWGGTGKTPMVIQLARAFQGRGRRVAVLTRGYGGDEPKLLRERLDSVPVLVGADRVLSAQRAIRDHGADLLLLDDGYQQWRIKKDVEILMADATSPFGNGELIPSGTLREPLAAAARADLIVVTRTKLRTGQMDGLKEKLRRANSEAPIFFASYRATGLRLWPSGKELGVAALRGKKAATFAGIARPEAFEETVKSQGADLLLTHRFRDHCPYTVGEIIRMMCRCQRHGIPWLITTAKDAVRIPVSLAEHLRPKVQGVELLVLEVALEFEPNESELLHRIDSLLGR